jgi:glycogen(starch) synthase
MLFEVAWEVCWQLGGIYTVLRSKAPAMIKRWEDRYCLIGPYNPATAAMEFEERPTEGVIRQVLDRLRERGIGCHYGRWVIPGRPRVILLDYRGRFSSLDHDKYLMWKDHGITCPPSDGEVNEVVAFGFTVAEFFRELGSLMTDRPILAHFHEWMAGVAVPRIAHLRLPVTTVFTTHATLLGRYLAGDNPYFYQQLPFIDGEHEADKYRILPKHQIEKAAAHAATVFTTVSEVTAREAAQLLQRPADVILPNGLNIQRFAALHEFQNLHQRYKERINEFVMGHFFPSYTFDLDKTLYFFTSGRYEYRNKGLDLYIESLYRLNQRLRQIPNPPTIVAFIITRAATRNINVNTLQSQAMFDELKNTCADIEKQMGRRLFYAATSGRLPNTNDLLSDESQVRLKRAIHVWRSTRQPAIITHDLQDDANDPILKHLRHRRLFNAADDPVKVVFHPEFLTATSPLLNLDYENFVRGCHLGIFPSYYEPWGYTPMESIALGVPAVTTDLSGFGAYVQRHVERNEDQGVFVLERSDRSFEESTESLVNYLMNFSRLNRRQRIELRNRVERLGEMFDWSILVRHYHDAHDLALERTHGIRPGKLEVKMV